MPQIGGLPRLSLIRIPGPLCLRRRRAPPPPFSVQGFPGRETAADCRRRLSCSRSEAFAPGVPSLRPSGTLFITHSLLGSADGREVPAAPFYPALRPVSRRSRPAAFPAPVPRICRLLMFADRNDACTPAEGPVLVPPLHSLCLLAGPQSADKGIGQKRCRIPFSSTFSKRRRDTKAKPRYVFRRGPNFLKRSAGGRCPLAGDSLLCRTAP